MVPRVHRGDYLLRGIDREAAEGFDVLQVGLREVVLRCAGFVNHAAVEGIAERGVGIRLPARQMLHIVVHIVEAMCFLEEILEGLHFRERDGP